MEKCGYRSVIAYSARGFFRSTDVYLTRPVILYGSAGQRLITAIDGKTPDPDTMGGLMFDPGTHYEIRDGHPIAYIGATPFEVTVYKLGNRYVAARRDEFGFANYEVEAAGQ